jgi:hypothetical protein
MKNEGIEESVSLCYKGFWIRTYHVLTMDIVLRNLIMITTYNYAGWYNSHVAMTSQVV